MKRKKAETCFFQKFDEILHPNSEPDMKGRKQKSFCFSEKGEERRISYSRNRWFAFSLIELLVVISVIAILIALILPALKTAKDKAREIQCVNQFKTFGQMLAMYANSYDDNFPAPINGWLSRMLSMYPDDFTHTKCTVQRKSILNCPAWMEGYGRADYATYWRGGYLLGNTLLNVGLIEIDTSGSYDKRRHRRWSALRGDHLLATEGCPPGIIGFYGGITYASRNRLELFHLNRANALLVSGAVIRIGRYEKEQTSSSNQFFWGRSVY